MPVLSTTSAALASDGPTSAAADAELAELAQAMRGHYRLLGLIDRGGMSAVYLAHELALERRVALKLLPGPSVALEDRERFRREARILAGLAHPNIVPVHAAGRLRGVSFMALRFVAGGSLATRLGREPAVPLAEACALGAQLASALNLVHAAGVVHRDVKPANILLDAELRPTLIDFGVAMLRTSDHSRSEVVRAFGTPTYMSPEHALGEQEVDGRSDIYSLGCVLFETLAGRPPFIGAAAREVVAQHVARPAPAPSVFRPEVPREVDRIVQRCLAKRPAQRWRDGASLEAALLEANAGARHRRSGFWRRR